MPISPAPWTLSALIKSYRCVDGRLMRHDPQPDDPDLETDRGVCPECDGKGCDDQAESR